MPVLLSFSYSIISIHALLAESDEFQSVGIAHLFISIHALLAESDRQSGALPQPPPHISIHALLAESDLSGLFHTRVNKISIHALLAESDQIRPFRMFIITNFYPRSPCGERQVVPS